MLRHSLLSRFAIITQLVMNLVMLLTSPVMSLAVVAIPGYMSHYCRAFDPAEIFNPFRALGRVREGRRAYWHAWSIALLAMALSFVGVIGLGIGFLFTSVWFWQVAGFSFASVFTQRFTLDGDPSAPPAATQH